MQSCVHMTQRLVRARQVLRRNIRKAEVIANIRGSFHIQTILAWEAVDEVTDRLNELELQFLEEGCHVAEETWKEELKDREYDI
jgi:hypothetical protein